MSHSQTAHQAAEPKEAAMLAGCLGTGPQYPSLLAAFPMAVKTPFGEPIFPDGIACTDILYKDSGIAPARLLICTTRALKGDPESPGTAVPGLSSVGAPG